MSGTTLGGILAYVYRIVTSDMTKPSGRARYVAFCYPTPRVPRQGVRVVRVPGCNRGLSAFDQHKQRVRSHRSRMSRRVATPWPVSMRLSLLIETRSRSATCSRVRPFSVRSSTRRDVMTHHDQRPDRPGTPSRNGWEVSWLPRAGAVTAGRPRPHPGRCRRVPRTAPCTPRRTGPSSICLGVMCSLRGGWRAHSTATRRTSRFFGLPPPWPSSPSSPPPWPSSPPPVPRDPPGGTGAGRCRSRR